MKHHFNRVKGPVMSCIRSCIPKLLLAFFCCISLSVYAQELRTTIKGLVENEKGEALQGVSVQLTSGAVKLTSITNKSGLFTFENAGIKGAYTIVISHIGFVSQTIKKENLAPGKEESIHVILKEDVSSLQEVVVSYGKQRASQVTGSIAQIDAGSLQDMPVGQFAQQLQGKAAGVQIAQSSGQPGRGMDFRIRGAASLFADNQPLFVIDGLPITGSINNINPSEIESFTILKDASSTSLYGSRAANGVILITTKHAKANDAGVEVSANFGIQKLPENKVPEVMNAREYAQFMKERWEDRVKYEGLNPNTTPLDPVYANPEQYGEGTNWYKVLTRTAPIQNYDVTIRSARERSSSTIIAGYQSQEGVVINTGTKLFTLRFNHDLSLSNNKLKIGLNVAPSYRRDHNNRLATDGVGGLFERIFEASPLFEPVNPDGTMPRNVYSPGMVAYINPYAQFKLSKDDYITTRILGNIYVNYEILKGLTLKTNLAADKGAETRNQFTPSLIASNSIATGLSSSVDNFSWTAEANLYYKKTFFNDHDIELLAGYSAQKYQSVSNSVAGTSYPSDEVPWISVAPSISAGSSNTNEFALLSTIARLNYAYKGRYLLQGAVRRDGSSKFGSKSRYGNFPSVSAGWIISEEPFMQNFRFLDFLKIRASYGITGNNSFTDNYAAIAKTSDFNYIVNGQLASGVTISALGNSALAWERNKQFDIGLELAILNNRIRFTYDYYHKFTDGMIQDRPIPRASGFSTIKFNIGEFEFWGHEFSISTVNTTGRLKWNSSVNVSFDRNVIKYLVSPGFLRRNNTVSSDYFRHQAGHSLGEFYGFVFQGLYKDSADLMGSARYGSASDVGTIKVKDINKDGVIDDVNDRTFIGDPTPDFIFGISNHFNYKHFDLNISMAGSVGGQILAAAKWAYQTNMDGSRMPLAAAADRWRSPEDPGSGIYPRTKTGTTAMGRQVNSQWVEDGSYLTVKNISLGYSLPLKGNWMMKALRVYASVQQAFVITGYSGMNPEINFSGLDATKGIGIDENAYPVPRTFSIGFTATFK